MSVVSEGYAISAKRLGHAHVSLAAATVLWTWPRPTLVVVHGTIGAYLLVTGIWHLLRLLVLCRLDDLPIHQGPRPRMGSVLRRTGPDAGIVGVLSIPFLGVGALIHAPPSSIAIGIGGCLIASALVSVGGLSSSTDG